MLKTDEFRLFIHCIPDKGLRNAILNAIDCKRFPVTALRLFNHPDYTGYMYSAYKAVCGLDPWTVITGVDRRIEQDQIILEYGSTGEIFVAEDAIVYAVEDQSNV